MTLGIIISLSIRISWSVGYLLATPERMKSQLVFPEEAYISFSPSYMVAKSTLKIRQSKNVDIFNQGLFPLPW